MVTKMQNIIAPHRTPNTRSIKKPPKKLRITFGQEYTEYNIENWLVLIPRSDIITSCRAAGLSYT